MAVIENSTVVEAGKQICFAVKETGKLDTTKCWLLGKYNFVV